MFRFCWCTCWLLLFAAACRNGGAPDDPASQSAGQPVGAAMRSPASTSPAMPTSMPAEAWHRPRSDERIAERERMVQRQLAARDIASPAVLEAMRNVPRHWFVPAYQQRAAYADRPLSIGEGQTISQPYIVALMTQALELGPDDKVLEIGTGSGYQAAVLAELTPHVYTIEIVESLASRAAEAFRRHGYNTIIARVGDGYAGWPEHAPFDAIIVTCAPEQIPPKLIEQLAVGGRMCLPVGPEGRIQRLLRLVKRPDGGVDRQYITAVAFVPMVRGDADN
jgi:protein-L-isoaspartate(D-aspartate) O-methyltransferase